MSNKICGEILQDQFQLLNLIADEQDIKIPVSKRSFKNLTNKEKAFFNNCLLGEVVTHFIDEIDEQQKNHHRALNTVLTLISKCETIEQVKMLTELDVVKAWKEKVADSGLIGDDDDGCACDTCKQVMESFNERCVK
jgi:hypothetical protein